MAVHAKSSTSSSTRSDNLSIQHANPRWRSLSRMRKRVTTSRTTLDEIERIYAETRATLMAPAAVDLANFGEWYTVPV